jgi:hypothetical protein
VITCPVCEHPQADGAECEVCGRSLLAPGAVEVPVAPLEGLEPTLAAPELLVGDLGVMPELEPTLQLSPSEVTLDPVPELEPTSAAPVEASGERVPDLEPTSAPASSDPRSELPLFPVCRYCRTPAGPGERICGRCGMMLPAGVAPAAVAVALPLLCSCGTPITRSTCPACGARNRTA